MPPVQTNMSSQPIQSSVGPNGMPMIQQVAAAPMYKKDNSGLIKTIVIIILSLVAVTFIGLFIWMLLQYTDASTDVQGQISSAVEQAKYEQREVDLAQFAEDEKYPLKAFAGPADYGELAFKYPKTWSVYIAKDAVNGGDYEAYLNPVQVDPVSRDSINALRLTIRNTAFESVAQEYQREVEKKDSELRMETVEINGITMNRYTGKIPNTELNGVIVIFKIRDKTAVLQTDAMPFVNDFDALLKTISFNA